MDNKKVESYITLNIWVCTSCAWTGTYAETSPVLYCGIEWQNCPSCNHVSIPKNGINSLKDDTVSKC